MMEEVDVGMEDDEESFTSKDPQLTPDVLRGWCDGCDPYRSGLWIPAQG